MMSNFWVFNFCKGKEPTKDKVTPGTAKWVSTEAAVLNNHVLQDLDFFASSVHKEVSELADEFKRALEEAHRTADSKLTSSSKKSLEDINNKISVDNLLTEKTDQQETKKLAAPKTPLKDDLSADISQALMLTPITRTDQKSPIKLEHKLQKTHRTLTKSSRSFLKESRPLHHVIPSLWGNHLLDVEAARNEPNKSTSDSSTSVMMKTLDQRIIFNVGLNDTPSGDSLKTLRQSLATNRSTFFKNSLVDIKRSTNNANSPCNMKAFTTVGPADSIKTTVPKNQSCKEVGKSHLSTLSSNKLARLSTNKSLQELVSSPLLKKSDKRESLKNQPSIARKDGEKNGLGNYKPHNSTSKCEESIISSLKTNFNRNSQSNMVVKAHRKSSMDSNTSCQRPKESFTITPLKELDFPNEGKAVMGLEKRATRIKPRKVTSVSRISKRPIKKFAGTIVETKKSLLRMNSQKAITSKKTRKVLPKILDGETSELEVLQTAEWAKSPNLKRILIKQQKIEPKKIFGDIPPVRVSNIFKK